MFEISITSDPRKNWRERELKFQNNYFTLWVSMLVHVKWYPTIWVVAKIKISCVALVIHQKFEETLIYLYLETPVYPLLPGTSQDLPMLTTMLQPPPSNSLLSLGVASICKVMEKIDDKTCLKYTVKLL